MSLYEALGIDRSAPPEAIRRAYRKAAKRAHPDAPTGSPEKFAAVSVALAVLSDPDRRKHYDQTGKVDEPQVNNTEAMAMNLVMGQLDGIVGRCAQLGWKASSVDMRGDAIKGLKMSLGQLAEQKHQFSERAKAFRKLSERWTSTKKDKPNRIRMMFEMRASDCDRSVAKVDEQVAIVEMAIAILSDHQFKYEAEVRYG